MSATDEETMHSDDRDSLERVREILFGTRARVVDHRVARIEARLANELSVMRDELRRRFGELEAHVRGEIEALSSRIEGESAARLEATSESARGQRELRRQILDMTRELGTQISRAREELFAALGDTGEAESQTAPAAETERPSLH
jgi:hypothetical protein